MFVRIFICAVVIVGFSTFSRADEPDTGWGDLSGRITFVGELPKIAFHKKSLRKLANGEKLPPNESLLVHPKNRGLANVVVWLKSKDVAVHPSFEKSARLVHPVAYIGNRLSPHVTLMRAGQTLRFDNRRVKQASAIQWLPLKNHSISPLIPPGEATEVTPQKPEPIPVRLSDSIRPWLIAYVFIQDHPYMALTDRNGRFEMANLPVGEWEFRFWHEKFGYLRDVKFNGVKTEFPRGLKQCKVEVGTNEIGKIEVVQIPK